MYVKVPRFALLFACFALAAGSAAAQGGDEELARRFQSIPWQAGPAAGDLGEQAEVQVPNGCRFTAARGADAGGGVGGGPSE